MVCLFAVLGILGASIILLRTHTYGVGIGSDETQYVSMARNLAEGNGFTNYMGRHPPWWPPLYPALLAVGIPFGLDAPDAARFLNATAFGLIVFLSGLYLARRVEFRLLALGVAMALLVSPTLMSVSSDALTDGLFLLLALLSLITLDGHLGSGRRSALVWAAVFASLSVLTRYAGALVVAIGFLMLLLNGRNGRGSLKNVVIYALVATLPISAWMVRNVVTGGTLLGRRRPVVEPVAVIRESMQTLVDVMFHSSWVQPWIEQLLGDVVALILGLAAVSLGYAVMFRRRFWRGDSFLRGPVKPVVLFGTFFLVYTCGLVLVILKTSISYQSPRHYLPSYVAFLFVTALLLDGLLRNPANTVLWRIGGAALVAVLLNSILAPMSRSFDETMWVMANGNKYTAKRWYDRRTISYIKTHAINDCFLSNVPDAIYVHADFRLEEFGFLPHSKTKNQTELIERTTRLAERGCDVVYIIWFNDEKWRRYPYGRLEIETWLDVQVVLDVPDGIIWRVERNGPAHVHARFDDTLVFGAS